jgi:hypothetical protein
MQATSGYYVVQGEKIDLKTISITGAWVRVIKGAAQVMLEIDGKWREIFPYTNIGDADVSTEITAEEIRKSQPLGWLYKEGG